MEKILYLLLITLIFDLPLSSIIFADVTVILVSNNDPNIVLSSFQFHLIY